MNNQQARNSAFPWRGHVLIRFAVCSLALWLPLEASAQETKSQSWVGGIAAGGFVGITLTISEQAAGKTATLDFVNQGPERQNLPVREVSVEGGRLRLKWDEPDGIAMLEGSQKIVDGKTDRTVLSHAWCDNSSSSHRERFRTLRDVDQWTSMARPSQ
jgi:hypothetical protein